jgi:predicted DsbA family dithiol-disulfide isomerase
MTTALKIDFVSDVSCPWCVIGLKALDQALERVKDDVQAELHFQPFELNPGMGAQGQEITEHITQKYGITPAQASSSAGRLNPGAGATASTTPLMRTVCCTGPGCKARASKRR